MTPEIFNRFVLRPAGLLARGLLPLLLLLALSLNNVAMSAGAMDHSSEKVSAMVSAAMADDHALHVSGDDGSCQQMTPCSAALEGPEAPALVVIPPQIAWNLRNSAARNRALSPPFHPPIV